jgi:hypothetical protein
MSDDPNAGTPPQGAAGSTAPPAPAAPTVAELRAQVMAELAAELKAATGHESIAAIKAAAEQAAAEKLAAEGRYKELAENAQRERDTIRAAYHGAQIRAALSAASAESLDPELVHTLLAAGAQVGQDGAVTVGGKSAADAVADLLKAKPFLAKPVGHSGSGGGSAGAAAVTVATMSFVQLAEMKSKDAAAYAAEIARRAGGKA